MKTLQDAHEHRARIFGAFEMAELEQDDDTRRAWLTFVVVGGGPTGVEVAGQIAELSRRSLGRNFRRFDPADARVILFDGARDILAAFGDHLASRGARELRRTGVEVVTETIVTAVDPYGVEVRGPDGEVRRIEARTKIWAAGVEASPLARMLAEACGAEVDLAGRIAVAPDCTIPGHPEVFAIGDMMTLDDLPGVAEVAMQQGAHAARTIRRRLGGDDRPGKAFRYRDLGSMATVSRFRAVASFHGVRLAGFLGWLAWLFVHLVFLTGFKNRFITVLYWFFSFLGRSRVERALDLDQIAAAERTDT
jgi:NADH dehydrogenase